MGTVNNCTRKLLKEESILLDRLTRTVTLFLNNQSEDLAPF